MSSIKFYGDLKLGILGGGQLGRMLIQSGISFDITTSVLDPNRDAPCHAFCHEFKTGSLTDYQTVYNFGKTCDIVTIEIENVNVQALKDLEREGVTVYPQPHVIEIIQDKRKQKEFYINNYITTSPFILTENKADVAANTDFLPAFQKLGVGGYDGGGVKRIKDAADAAFAFDAPGLLEKAVDFDKEISVIVARNAAGEVKAFPAVEQVLHPEHNLVDYLFAPSDLTEEQEEAAKALAIKTTEALGIVGILAVELFLDKDGTFLVNEVAPRPHNSGHQTINANYTSQYEQHLRCILGLPLGSAAIKRPSAMVNLLGAEGYTGSVIYEGIEDILKIEGVNIFLYGKKVTKPNRKMGHITILGDDIVSLKEKVALVKKSIKVIA